MANTIGEGTSVDQEIAALATCVGAMEGRSEEERDRILRFLHSRYAPQIRVSSTFSIGAATGLEASVVDRPSREIR